jgi:hypothetical protein
MSVETSTYDFFDERIAAAESGTALKGVELHKTSYDRVTKTHVIQIGPCQSDFAPTPGMTEAREYNARLVLILLAKVGDRKEPASFNQARQDVLDMATAAAFELLQSPDLGGRERDCQTGRFARDFTNIDGHPYAVGNLPLFLNWDGTLPVDRR